MGGDEVKETISQAQTRNTISLFVYGTLKRGYWNHGVYCREAVGVEEAHVRGRLYELPSGIPVLQVPGDDIIAHGTSDPLADVATQCRTRELLLANTRDGAGDWQMIRGEVIMFGTPRLSLPPIDRLEGFRPGKPSLYRRVLVPVLVLDEWAPAWCYVAGEHIDLCGLPCGRTQWPE